MGGEMEEEAEGGSEEASGWMEAGVVGRPSERSNARETSRERLRGMGNAGEAHRGKQQKMSARLGNKGVVSALDGWAEERGGPVAGVEALGAGERVYDGMEKRINKMLQPRKGATGRQVMPAKSGYPD